MGREMGMGSGLSKFKYQKSKCKIIWMSLRYTKCHERSEVTVSVSIFVICHAELDSASLFLTTGEHR